MIKKLTALTLVLITANIFSLQANSLKKYESIIEKRNAKHVKTIKEPLKNKFNLSITAQRTLASRFFQIETIDYWNDTTSQWDSVLRNIYSFDELGRLYLTTLTDVKTGPGLQIELFYNNNKVEEAVMRLYDKSTATWYDWVRDLYTYDVKGRLIERLYQEYDTTLNIWSTKERESMTFNQNDLMSMYLLEQNDGNNWIGIDGIKLEYVFDQNDRNILDMAIYLDPSDQSWDTVDRMHHAYTTSGTLTRNIYQLYNNGVWENSVKEEVQLDANEVAIGDLFFNYNLSTSNWDSTERLIDMTWFKWNGRISNSEPKEYIVQYYDSILFINNNKYVATQPDFNGSLIEERFKFINGQWVPDSKASTIFDDFGNQINFMFEMYIDTAYVLLAQNTSEITYDNGAIVEMKYRELDPSTGILKYTSRFRYSALILVGINNTKSNSSLNIYPNPINTNDRINIDISKTSTVSINIYNQLGERIIDLCNNQKIEKGVHSFNINIPSGIYIIHTFINDELFTNKIIVE